MTDHEAALFRFEDGGCNVPRGDAEGCELPMRGFQIAVLPAASAHVLNHQEAHNTEGVDAERAESSAFQNLAGQLDELFLAHGRPSPFSTSSQSVSATGET